MIGQNIRKIREYRLLGLNETARKANISPSYLSALEKGVKANPSVDKLKDIADVLGMDIDEFFKGESIISSGTSDMNIDQVIRYYEEALLIIKEEEVNLIYRNTLKWLKELKELRTFKENILAITNSE